MRKSAAAMSVCNTAAPAIRVPRMLARTPIMRGRGQLRSTHATVGLSIITPGTPARVPDPKFAHPCGETFANFGFKGILASYGHSNLALVQKFALNQAARC